MIPGILGLETTHVVMPWSAVDKDVGPGVGCNSVSSGCERLLSYPGGVLRGIWKIGFRACGKGQAWEPLIYVSEKNPTPKRIVE